jgi:hypothetical protein
MSKFIIGVSAGIANVYPYGMASNMTKVLKANDALLCEVPVGDHVEPQEVQYIAKPAKEYLRGMAEEDKAAPAAGVADQPPGQRTGTLVVAVTDGEVTVRTYEGTEFTEIDLRKGETLSAEVTESNHITLAVYDAQPHVEPRA